MNRFGASAKKLKFLFGFAWPRMALINTNF